MYQSLYQMHQKKSISFAQKEPCLITRNCHSMRISTEQAVLFMYPCFLIIFSDPQNNINTSNFAIRVKHVSKISQIFQICTERQEFSAMWRTELTHRGVILNYWKKIQWMPIWSDYLISGINVRPWICW